MVDPMNPITAAKEREMPDKMTEQEIDARWPVLAQVVRAIEWHGDHDLDFFRHTFSLEREFTAEQADAAEIELAAATGAQIVEIITTEAGETHPAAPMACIVLSRYFA